MIKIKKEITMKKLFGTMAVAAALFTGYNAYNANINNELTDIALTNVEALAESTENNCPGGACSYTASDGSTCTACCPANKIAVCNSIACFCS